LLNEKNIYIITVSATPFSEICNIHHQHQPKQIIFLKPDAEAGYLGLGEFWRNGQIIGFDTSVSSILKLVTDIASKMRTNQVKKYGIIRCSSVSGGKDPEDVRLIESVKEIAKRYGIHTVEYDSESKKNDVYLKLVNVSMGGSTTEEENRNLDKIAKNVVKEVFIDKSIL
jgi:hypothetical protein